VETKTHKIAKDRKEGIKKISLVVSYRFSLVLTLILDTEFSSLELFGPLQYFESKRSDCCVIESERKMKRRSGRILTIWEGIGRVGSVCLHCASSNAKESVSINHFKMG